VGREKVRGKRLKGERRIANVHGTTKQLQKSGAKDKSEFQCGILFSVKGERSSPGISGSARKVYGLAA